MSGASTAVYRQGDGGNYHAAMQKFSMVLAGFFLAGCGASITPQHATETSLNVEDNGDLSADRLVGEYFCTVTERASIEGLHLEGSGPPRASVAGGNPTPQFGSPLPTRFRIRIEKAPNQSVRLIELSYTGRDRDQTEWQTDKSVLHSDYQWDGRAFSSMRPGSEGFFLLQGIGNRNFRFRHAGVEAAGGEDEALSIRSGPCERI